MFYYIRTRIAQFVILYPQIAEQIAMLIVMIIFRTRIADFLLFFPELLDYLAMLISMIIS